MRRCLFIILLLLLGCVQPLCAKIERPDFKKPRTVAAQALKNLEQANKKHNDRAAVEAVLQLITAVDRIGDDRQAIAGPNPGGDLNMYAMPGLVQRQIELATNPSAKAMLWVIMADVYADLHAVQRPRTAQLPADSVPRDISLWTREIFQSQAVDCYSKAMEQANIKSESLDKWRDIIDVTWSSMKIFPNVVDFVAVKANGSPLLNDVNKRVLLKRVIRNSTEHSYPQLYWLCRLIETEFADDPDTRIERLGMLYQHEQDHVQASLVLEEFADLCAERPEYRNWAFANRLFQTIDKNQGYPGNDRLEWLLVRLVRPEIKLTAPNRVAVGHPVTVDMTARSANVEVGAIVTQGSVEVSRLQWNPHNMPLAQSSNSLEFIPLEAGEYGLIPMIDGNPDVDEQKITVHATTVTPSAIDADGTAAVCVRDSWDGAPVPGMTVYVYCPEGQADDMEKIGRTDSTGVLYIRRVPELCRRLNNSKEYHRYKLAVVRDSTVHDILTPAHLEQMTKLEDYDLSYNPPRDNKSVEQSNVRGVLLTDRAAYRPGNEVQWLAIADVDSLGKVSPMINTAVNVTLTDIQGKQVGNANAVTDQWGRATGSLTLPADAKAGRYSLKMEVVSADGSQRSSSGSAWAGIDVSDFKLPAIKVDIDSVAVGSETVVTGRAATYAGTPVSNAKVLLSTHRISLWRFGNEENTDDVKASGVTDAAGRFSIVLGPTPNATVSSPYYVQANVVSAQGETGTANQWYMSPRPYEIIQTAETVDAEQPVFLPVKVCDAAGAVIDEPLKYELFSHRGLKANRALASLLPTGTVTLQPSAEGTVSSLADMLDWRFLESGDYALHVSAADSTKAFKQIFVVKLYNPANNTMPASEPIFVPKRQLSGRCGETVELLYGVPKTAHVTIISTDRCGNDLVVPNIKNVVTDSGFHRLTVPLPDRPGRLPVQLSTVINGRTYNYMCEITAQQPQPELKIASFRDKITAGGRERWTLTMASQSDDKQFASCLLAYNSALQVLTDYRLPGLNRLLSNATYNHVYVQGPYWHEMSVTMLWPIGPMPELWYRQPAFVYGKRYSRVEMKADVLYRAAAAPVANASNDTGDAAGTVAESTPAAEAMSIYDFRPAEQLQALWMPRLVSGADGVLTVEFDAPVTNGSWTLQALGWNRDMQSASLTREFVTRRPVMVHSVLPRFLRQGDEATVHATVSSGMDRAARVSVAFELFDLSTDSVFQRVSRTVELQPDSTAAVSATITAPYRARTIGCRVLAVSGNYSDGEQADIPVLLAGIQVRDADFTFYPDGAKRSDIQLPPAQPGVRTWLDFCDRPVDNVAKIIEVVSVAEPHDVIAASAQIYYATVAAQLKAAGMELSCDSLLHDARTRAVQVLTDCHRATGGWSWGDWQSQPSEWLTYGVLRNIAGSGDSRLDSLAMKALEFVQTCALADHDFAPGPNFDFAEVCALYPQFKPSQLGRSLIDLTVKYVANDWDKAYITQRPRYALLLQSYGRQGEARKILKSINQYTVREENGLVWIPKIKDIDAYATLIEAYNRLDPAAPELRGMQAWLIRRTVATENFSACRPVGIVQALLPLVRCDRLMAWAAVYSESTQHAADIAASQSDRLSISRRLLVRDAGPLRDADTVRLGQEIEVQLTVKATEDLDYVEVTDMLPAGLQVVEQLGGYRYEGGVGYHYQPGATDVKLYIGSLPRGTHVLTYRLTAATAGRFATGVAVVQSLPDPSATAHSSASQLTVE